MIKNIAKIFIRFSFNNVQVVVVNIKGKVVFKVSSGIISLKNSQKGSMKAGDLVASLLGQKLSVIPYSGYLLFITGFGRSRFSFINGISKKIKIIAIHQSTKLAFNGCKKKKARRL